MPKPAMTPPSPEKMIVLQGTRFRIGVEAANARGLFVGNQSAIHPLFGFGPQPTDFFAHTFTLCPRILHVFQEECALKKFERTSG